MEHFKVLDRELDHREFDGIEVTLKWVPGTVVTYVEVADTKLNQFFRVSVPEPGKEYDVFHHPFSYHVDEIDGLEPVDYGNAA